MQYSAICRKLPSSPVVWLLMLRRASSVTISFFFAICFGGAAPPKQVFRNAAPPKQTAFVGSPPLDAGWLSPSWRTAVLDDIVAKASSAYTNAV